MNIGQYLKEIGKTKTELADELGLSRPTLNAYIDQFEVGRKIENDRYDIIFNNLFSDRSVNRELFDRKLDSAKYLLERDKKYDIGTLSPDAADLVARIHNIMVTDLGTDDCNRKVYDTVIAFLTRYKKDVIFLELSGYFSDLNSDSDLSELSESTKAYYSYFYKCFRELINKQPDLDIENYDAFLKRRSQLSKAREERNAQKADKIKNMINNKLREVEKEYLDNGIEASEEDLINELVKRMREQE